MASTPTPSWLQKAVGACFYVLAGAIALHAAVKLIEAVAVTLILIVLAALLVAIVITFVRARNRDW